MDWQKVANERAAEIARLSGRIHTYERLTAKLDGILKAGGVCDLSFHIGQVKALLEHNKDLERELKRLKGGGDGNRILS